MPVKITVLNHQMHDMRTPTTTVKNSKSLSNCNLITKILTTTTTKNDNISGQQSPAATAAAVTLKRASIVTATKKATMVTTSRNGVGGGDGGESECFLTSDEDKFVDYYV